MNSPMSCIYSSIVPAHLLQLFFAIAARTACTLCAPLVERHSLPLAVHDADVGEEFSHVQLAQEVLHLEVGLMQFTSKPHNLLK
mmetsp:Transcript_93848/g.171982  ORF Transcript_93848/g.171982 Transcript_93848/m.171982 type:complete len:84 (+) Transcript_93848:2-253(+)